MQLPPISHVPVQASPAAQQGETPNAVTSKANIAANSLPHAMYLRKSATGNATASFKAGHAAGGERHLPSLDAIPHAKLFKTDEQRNNYAMAWAELDDIYTSSRHAPLQPNDWKKAYAVLEKMQVLNEELMGLLMPAPGSEPDTEMQRSLQQAVKRSQHIFDQVQHNRAGNAGLRQAPAAKL